MNEKIILVGGILLILLIIYFILKFCGKFRNKVYQLFLKAEKVAESGTKMDYVVENLYTYLPSVMRVFINERALRWILQKMFDVVEDFLNDGRLNGNEDE